MTKRKHSGNAKVIPDEALFLPYQKHWIEDDSRLKLMEKSRQIGISWSSAYGLLRRKVAKDATLDAWVSSRDEIQARLFLDDCKKFGNILNTGAKDLGEQALDDNGSTAFVMSLANNNRIFSLSSSVDAQAGKRGDRLLDEFALHKDPRKLYSIAYPGITWGGLLEIVSTHRGSANFFNHLVREIKEKDNPKGFSLHTVTLQDALEQGFLYKLQNKLPVNDPRQAMDEAEYFDYIKNSCADEESFLQEYMCKPADDASAFLEYDLIASCEENILNVFDVIDLNFLNSTERKFYVGFDVARKVDLSVIWINEYVANRHVTKRIIVLKNAKFSTQRAILYGILDFKSVKRCCIDATGIGAQLAEEAIDAYGSYKVEAIIFTMASKAELAYPLRASFEDKNVIIPYDLMVRKDLRSIKKETTASGNIRFTADHGDNGHADRFWALALAVHAVDKNYQEVVGEVTPKATNNDDDDNDEDLTQGDNYNVL